MVEKKRQFIVTILWGHQQLSACQSNDMITESCEPSGKLLCIWSIWSKRQNRVYVCHSHPLLYIGINMKRLHKILERVLKNYLVCNPLFNTTTLAKNLIWFAVVPTSLNKKRNNFFFSINNYPFNNNLKITIILIYWNTDGEMSYLCSEWSSDTCLMMKRHPYQTIYDASLAIC